MCIITHPKPDLLNGKATRNRRGSLNLPPASKLGLLKTSEAEKGLSWGNILCGQSQWWRQCRIPPHLRGQRREAIPFKDRAGTGSPGQKIPYGQNQETWALVTKASDYSLFTKEVQRAHHSPPAAASTMRGAL